MKLFHSAIAAASLCMVGLAAAPVQAQYGRTTIYNNGYYTSVERVWTAPVGYGWVETPLNASIQPGQNQYLDWANTSHCFYDIKFQMSDGTIRMIEDVAVCRGEAINVY